MHFLVPIGSRVRGPIVQPAVVMELKPAQSRASTFRVPLCPTLNAVNHFPRAVNHATLAHAHRGEHNHGLNAAWLVVEVLKHVTLRVTFPMMHLTMAQ